MTKMSLGTHPFLLGFDQLERMVEQAAKSGKDGYQDLSITVENAKLVVRGAQADTDEARVFLHRGIAARQFMKSFVLAEGVEVTGAKTESGLLHIDLERVEHESIVQTIQIKKG